MPAQSVDHVSPLKGHLYSYTNQSCSTFAKHASSENTDPLDFDYSAAQDSCGTWIDSWNIDSIYGEIEMRLGFLIVIYCYVVYFGTWYYSFSLVFEGHMHNSEDQWPWLPYLLIIFYPGQRYFVLILV